MEQETEKGKFAYVTLLYSNFVSGTRALGQSLRDTGTKADTVVLVTPDVSDGTKTLLKKDGWTVLPVEVTNNPNAGYQSRLIYVYTKLLIFGLTEYDRIVFLDSDVLVLENVDELFTCGPFCAVMRHGELLNSGVLVVTPSKPLHEHMQAHFGELDSYTGGDQGFLNSYYSEFARCPMFEPLIAQLESLETTNTGVVTYEPHISTENNHMAIDLPPHSGRQKQWQDEQMKNIEEKAKQNVQEGNLEPDLSCWRLPSRYNGDWPLLFVDGDVQRAQGGGRGSRDEKMPEYWQLGKRVKILHFTFGTAKPWVFWTYPFLPYVGLWAKSYSRLPRTSTRPLLLIIIAAALIFIARLKNRPFRRRRPMTADLSVSASPPYQRGARQRGWWEVCGGLISILGGLTLLGLSIAIVATLAGGTFSPGEPAAAWVITVVMGLILFSILAVVVLRAIAYNESDGAIAEWRGGPMKETVGHFLVLGGVVIALGVGSLIRDVDHLSLVGTLRHGLPTVAVLTYLCVWSFRRLPRLWGTYGKLCVPGAEGWPL